MILTLKESIVIISHSLVKHQNFKSLNDYTNVRKMSFQKLSR